jgi:hypothetical protein
VSVPEPAPNKAVEPTANSVRCAPAVGGGSPRALGEQPTRLRILRGESPLPSIARFGRLAYPGHGEVTNRERLGWKRHGCPGYLVSCGRSDLSGKQTCGLEHERMTAAPKFAAVLKSLHGI